MKSPGFYRDFFCGIFYRRGGEVARGATAREAVGYWPLAVGGWFRERRVCVGTCQRHVRGANTHKRVFVGPNIDLVYNIPSLPAG